MLQAGGGPASPDPLVLRALTTPVVGQFDPAFTAIMDEVMQLARLTLLTANERCFAVSALAAGGLEAVVNTLVADGDRVAVGGGPRFSTEIAALLRRYGAEVSPLDELSPSTSLAIVPLVDPTHGTLAPVHAIADRCHSVGCALVVDATLGLAATELRVDDWAIDACIAGVEYAVGAPAGMALVTYTADLEARMLARGRPPRTSYLDLLQLQAYWSAERLNHHTAPTSLVYGLREALRLVQLEGLAACWERHRHVGDLLRQGLRAQNLDVGGDGPYAIVRLPASADEADLRRRLREDFDIQVTRVTPDSWRLGLLGADARPQTVRRVLLTLGTLLAGR